MQQPTSRPRIRAESRHPLGRGPCAAGDSGSFHPATPSGAANGQPSRRRSRDRARPRHGRGARRKCSRRARAPLAGARPRTQALRPVRSVRLHGDDYMLAIVDQPVGQALAESPVLRFGCVQGKQRLGLCRLLQRDGVSEALSRATSRKVTLHKESHPTTTRRRSTTRRSGRSSRTRWSRGLEVRVPGEVLLVDAGLFGKALCVHMRDRDGIALEMGSVLDKPAGKATVGGTSPCPMHRRSAVGIDQPGLTRSRWPTAGCAWAIGRGPGCCGS